jgi:DNA-binding MarR family transcriptional regulator
MSADLTPGGPADDAPLPALLADDAGHLMARIAEGLGSRHLLALAELGLSLRSFGVLGLACETARDQITISRLTGIDRTTVVAIVDDLEAAGLVLRRPSPADRRARLVEPTPSGRSLADQALQRVRGIQDEHFAALSATEREQLMTTLRRLATGPLAHPADLSGIAATPRRRPRRGLPG